MNVFTLQTASLSHGKIDTRSMTSQLIFSVSLANSATSISTWICVPQPINVTSLPVRNMSALPNGHSNASFGTSSTAARYNVFGSKTMHGSCELQLRKSTIKQMSMTKAKRAARILYLLCKPAEDLSLCLVLLVWPPSIRACERNNFLDFVNDRGHHVRLRRLVHVSSTIHNRINFHCDSDIWLPHLQSTKCHKTWKLIRSVLIGTYLIESRKNIIGKLYFSNCCSSSIRNTNTKPSNALLA